MEIFEKPFSFVHGPAHLERDSSDLSGIVFFEEPREIASGYMEELVGVKKEKSCCVRDLADRLQISQPNVSHHLKVLKTAGFISCQKSQEEDQRFAYYSVDKDRIDVLFKNVLEEIH